MTDSIADMLTRIRNAYAAGKESISMPSSKERAAIAQVMLDAGYLEKSEVAKDAKGFENLVLGLKYSNGTPAITEIKRISKPGVRTYVTCAKIPQVLHGYGLAILSTSVGILSGSQAKKKAVGGELLCQVW
ncbi:MAG: 30S ribosomal protein S8 [bacterium]|nr:30S ribosomal protein S8 [bacterium]